MSIDDAISRGVVAIWTDPEGRVIAVEADFDKSGYGGFSLAQSQSMRARKAVQREAVCKYCSPVLTDCLDGHSFDRIAELMMYRGHKITLRTIGHDDATKNEIE